jgi:translation initiation factor 2 alpha subunit (eIF-2alpha)
MIPFFKKEPSIKDLVYCKIIKSDGPVIEVYLFEYNLKGYLDYSNVTRRNVKSFKRLVKVGRREVLEVINKEKGINLSKKNVMIEDLIQFKKDYKYRKIISNVLYGVHKKFKVNLEDLYKLFIWKLPRNFFTWNLFSMKSFAIDLKHNLILIEKKYGKNVSLYIENQLQNKLSTKIKGQTHINITCFEKEGINSIKKILLNCKHEHKVTIKLITNPNFYIEKEGSSKTDVLSTLKSCLKYIQENKNKYGVNFKITKKPFIVKCRDESLMEIGMKILEDKMKETEDY